MCKYFFMLRTTQSCIKRIELNVKINLMTIFFIVLFYIEMKRARFTQRAYIYCKCHSFGDAEIAWPVTQRNTYTMLYIQLSENAFFYIKANISTRIKRQSANA